MEDFLRWSGKCPRSRHSALLSPTQRADVLKRKRSEAALEQVRAEGAIFAAHSQKRTLPPRPITVRVSKEAQLVQERYANYIATTEAQIASLKAEHIEQLQKLQHTISQQHKQLVSLRIQYRSQLQKNQRERKNQEATRVAAVRGRRKLAGGNSRPTLIKLAKAVENSLNFLFSTPHTRQAALYQHFIRNP
jgi:hypothetical protein